MVKFDNNGCDYMYIDKNFNIFLSTKDIRIQKPYFECDELFAPTICILNKKGYKTKHCCSGHIIDEKSVINHQSYHLIYNYAYIIFDKKYDFFHYPKYTNTTVINNGYIVERQYNLDKDLYKQQLEIAKDYYNWANNLSPIGGE